ncbi:hypothetical protein ACTMU2_21905 [Cupriavidus basilensis]
MAFPEEELKTVRAGLMPTDTGSDDSPRRADQAWRQHDGRAVPALPDKGDGTPERHRLDDS